MALPISQQASRCHHGWMDAFQRAARTVAQTGGYASDADFADEALTAVAAVLPHDGYCLFGVDFLRNACGLGRLLLGRRRLPISEHVP